MKAISFGLVVLSFIAAFPLSAEETARPTVEHAEGRADAGIDEKDLRSRTSEKFDKASSKIKEMVERDTKRFTQLAEEYAANIKKGMDNGTIESVLHQMLVEHDTWGGKEEEEVFGDTDDQGKKINRFDQLSDNEKLIISLDYTRERKKLRALLHDKVAELLKGSKDLRIQALEPKLAELKKSNLDAWDRGLAKIAAKYKEDPTRVAPICFTCGEPVSVDPNYEFSTEMTNVIGKVLVEAGLSDEDGRGKAFYNPSKFARTKGGTLVKPLIGDDGTMYGYTGVNNAEDQRKLGTDRDMVQAARNHYLDRLAANQYDMKKVFPGNPAAQKQADAFISWADKNFLNKPAEAALAAVGAVSTGAKPGPTAGLDHYLDEVEALGAPIATNYPTPEVMAAKIGLTDPKGEPYVQYKGKGKHWDGTQEFGVKMLWDKIRYAEPQERARVMEILKKVASAPGPGKYKVMNGKDGYCLWCNIRHDATSVSMMSSLK